MVKKTIEDIKKSNVHRCSDCKFWNRNGGISIKRPIGNAGLCAYLSPQHREMYHFSNAPYWAENVAYQTMSFDGSGCDVFSKASAAQIKKNNGL